MHLETVITCPVCGHSETEQMQTNACRYFYEMQGLQATAEAAAG
jgi:hypothetical protein